VSATESEARPPWPAWSGIAALLIGFVIAVVASILLAALLHFAGVEFNSDSPGLTFGLTVVQDACLVGAVLYVAAQTARPRATQFGLRASRLWPSVGWAALAFGISVLASVLYVVGLGVDVEQTTLKDLGAGTSTAVTILIGVLVVGAAPVVEEFVFRGFIYGALRTRFSFLPAAALDGVLFGAVHATSGVKAIPPLIVLGFTFCMVYEATGSIVPTICLHALNNMIAFGGDKDGSWAAAAPVAVAVIAGSIAYASRNPAARTRGAVA
jgi:membrane protease YdiL (CAAX protease family)